MLSPYLLAREHLQCAALALTGHDSRSRQLRYIIERTVTLMEDYQPVSEPQGDNVLNFAQCRDRLVGSN
jgi:hypothetical protein